ncbi:hypothetical protein NMY22_g13368 [Coprinellus aureogranulatus]|nr:hypothetical protein NMY22_g13368 [Coprinellus aureogranulatus]
MTIQAAFKMEHQNDSQTTLVNPSEAYLELVVEKSSILNTRLLVDGRPRYKISTTDRDAAHTKVFDLRTNQEISSYKHRAVFPDQVKFTRRFGGRSFKKDEWMVKTKLDTG